MLLIPREIADAMGGAEAIAQAVAAFAELVEAHRFTVDVPAPTAHPTIEDIVRVHGGQFEIETPAVPNPIDKLRAFLEANPDVASLLGGGK